MRILVVGATSFWGSPLVDELRARGQDVSVFSRDPRAFPDSWRMALRCSFGELRHEHILADALEGVDRVVASVNAGRDPDQADATEVAGMRCILAAMSVKPEIDLVRLTSPPPLRDADWWLMAARRRADLLVETSKIRHCNVQMGWAPEMLAPLLRGTRLWLPHPISAPGKIAWQSRSGGVERLADLVCASELPPHAYLRGKDIASLGELSTRICVENRKFDRIHLPGRFFRWMTTLRTDLGFAGTRLIHAGSPSGARLKAGDENCLTRWPVARPTRA